MFVMNELLSPHRYKARYRRNAYAASRTDLHVHDPTQTCFCRSIVGFIGSDLSPLPKALFLRNYLEQLGKDYNPNSFEARQDCKPGRATHHARSSNSPEQPTVQTTQKARPPIKPGQTTDQTKHYVRPATRTNQPQTQPTPRPNRAPVPTTPCSTNPQTQPSNRQYQPPDPKTSKAQPPHVQSTPRSYQPQTQTAPGSYNLPI